MAREFKPVRFFVMMALAVFVACGVTAFTLIARPMVELPMSGLPMQLG
jgi:hypothetical protein